MALGILMAAHLLCVGSVVSPRLRLLLLVYLKGPGKDTPLLGTRSSRTAAFCAEIGTLNWVLSLSVDNVMIFSASFLT